MLRARLRPHGLLVLNVIGEKHRIDAVVGAAAEAFGGRLIVMNVGVGGNRLLFAFNDADYVPDWQALKLQAEFLGARYGLDFPKFAKRQIGRASCRERGCQYV